MPKPTDDILALEQFLPYRLNRLAEDVSRDFSRIYRDRFGLTRPEWRLLATLGQYGSMTATAVGQHSAMHKTKVSRAVAELQQRHWLTRTPDDADRRIEHLQLTNTGLAAYREMVPLAKAFEANLLKSLPVADRERVLALIAQLAAASGAAGR